MDVSDQHYPQAALSPVPIEQEADGTQNLSGRFGKKEISCSCRDSKTGPSTPQPTVYTHYAIPRLKKPCP